MGIVTNILRRPLLWVEGMVTLATMRRRGGWAVDGRYLDWRRFTAYGDASAAPPPSDVVEYLSWRRRQRSMRR